MLLQRWGREVGSPVGFRGTGPQSFYNDGMRRRVLPVLFLLLLFVAPVRLGAWGMESHRELTGLALSLLPDELRPFFESRRAFVVEHSVDPDLWRLAGFDDEAPRHFLDMDAYGAHPFHDLPREYDVAVQRYGREFVHRNGQLPWRIAEVYGNLVRSFEEVKKGTSPYALDNAAFHAAVLAHYVGDAHVPFHAIVNYDGQLTNQHGVHARFESELVRRYRSRIAVRPEPGPPVSAPRDFAFKVLTEGFELSAPLLEADLKAIGDGTTYDDAYFDRFFEAARPTLERRLSESASAIAAMVAGAWEAAGRPAVPVDLPQRVRTRRVPPAK